MARPWTVPTSEPCDNCNCAGVYHQTRMHQRVLVPLMQLERSLANSVRTDENDHEPRNTARIRGDPATSSAR